MKTKEEGRLINFRPICAVAAFFAVGIACAFFLKFNVGAMIACFAALVLISVSAVVFGENVKRGFIVLAVLIAVFAAGFGYSFAKIKLAEGAEAPDGFVEVTATVESFSALSSGGFRIVFRNCAVSGAELDGGAVGYFDSGVLKNAFEERAAVNAGKLTFPSENRPSEGDRMSFYCYVQNRAQGGESTYDVFSGVAFSVSGVKNARYAGDDANVFEKTARWIKGVMSTGLDGDAFPLAIALTLGDTSLVGDKISAFRFAGIAHVFAVSGLHVGLFFAILAFIAKKLGLVRLKRLAFIFIPTLFYCFLCGFRPSSVRALVMAATVILAEDLGFKRDGLSAIALALIVILMIEPFYLFDTGTRLSFLAVVGIAVLAPVFKRGAKPLGTVGELLSVTLGATLATLPVLVDMSGYMSLISLFANLLFVPIFSLAYELTAVSAALGCVEFLVFKAAKITLFLPSAFLGIIGEIVAFFDFSVFALPLSFGFASVFYYVGLLFTSDLFNLSGKKKAIVVSTAFVLTALTVALEFFA